MDSVARRIEQLLSVQNVQVDQFKVCTQLTAFSELLSCLLTVPRPTAAFGENHNKLGCLINCHFLNAMISELSKRGHYRLRHSSLIRAAIAAVRLLNQFEKGEMIPNTEGNTASKGPSLSELSSQFNLPPLSTQKLLQRLFYLLFDLSDITFHSVPHASIPHDQTNWDEDGDTQLYFEYFPYLKEYTLTETKNKQKFFKTFIAFHKRLLLHHKYYAQQNKRILQDYLQNGVEPEFIKSPSQDPLVQEIENNLYFLLSSCTENVKFLEKSITVAPNGPHAPKAWGELGSIFEKEAFHKAKTLREDPNCSAQDRTLLREVLSGCQAGRRALSRAIGETPSQVLCKRKQPDKSSNSELYFRIGALHLLERSVTVPTPSYRKNEDTKYLSDAFDCFEHAKNLCSDWWIYHLKSALVGFKAKQLTLSQALVALKESQLLSDAKEKTAFYKLHCLRAKDLHELAKFNFNSAASHTPSADPDICRTELLENVILALKDIQTGPCHHKALFLLAKIYRFAPAGVQNLSAGIQLMEETLFIKQGKHKATGFLFMKPTTDKQKSHRYFEQCYELYVDLLVRNHRLDKLWNFLIRVFQSKKEKKEYANTQAVHALPKFVEIQRALGNKFSQQQKLGWAYKAYLLGKQFQLPPNTAEEITMLLIDAHSQFAKNSCSEGIRGENRAIDEVLKQIAELKSISSKLNFMTTEESSEYLRSVGQNQG